jgi:hypothetical protein
MESDWYKTLCEGLNLKPMDHVQDFGVIYSNPHPGKILEYVEYFEKHPELSDIAKVMLAELIIASIDEAMQIQEALADHLPRFARFMRTFLQSEPCKKNDWMIKYWLPKEEDADSWPVGRWMNTLGPGEGI